MIFARTGLNGGKSCSPHLPCMSTPCKSGTGTNALPSAEDATSAFQSQFASPASQPIDVITAAWSNSTNWSAESQ